MMLSQDLLTSWLVQFDSLVEEHKEYLTDLDSPIGDADHGNNMARGMHAAIENLNKPSLSALFKAVGMALVSKVGGSAGPLYGTFFMKAAKPLGDGTEVSEQDFAAALHAGLDGVTMRGKAELGDKTMVDSLTPAISVLEEGITAGTDFADVADQAAEAAMRAAEATTPMLAKKGRASYLGERSIGHQDPGATSTAYLFQALALAAHNAQ
ncbi:MAG: dihydroxyacetone kinase subunit DhaL [Actinomycetaceae bacterium]|nr:dihydroxyacetone kinase subunit DhaL [Actinomycetaceae bacterium]MDY6082660.1 dihydroxyacetone kinase subunit DhaL [Actinomycetaceae bacterium]